MIQDSNTRKFPPLCIPCSPSCPLPIRALPSQAQSRSINPKKMTATCQNRPIQTKTNENKPKPTPKIQTQSLTKTYLCRGLVRASQAQSRSVKPNQSNSNQFADKPEAPREYNPLMRVPSISQALFSLLTKCVKAS